jgi:hypothetical protein
MTVEHLAIDLGGRKSQVCVRNEAGKNVDERRLSTHDIAGFLAGRTKGRVTVETCAEAFAVADAAFAAGHEVRVIPSTFLVRSLGVGARGVRPIVRRRRESSARVVDDARLRGSLVMGVRRCTEPVPW